MAQKEVNINCTLTEVQVKELSAENRALILAAQEARKGSHSPYSNFSVGAAVLHTDGTMIKGSNQENAAYPSGLCAERTALFYSRANFGEKEVKSLAVAVDERSTNVPFPCGGCLQVISEFEQLQKTVIQIFLIHPSESVVWQAQGVKNLLPFAFGKEHLIK